MAVTFFSSWKRACSGGKAWHTVSQIQTIWIVFCLDYFLTSVDRRSHGTHRKGRTWGREGLCIRFWKTLRIACDACDAVTEKGCQMCVDCFVRRPRSVSLPSQGQLGVEPSGSELNPKHLKEKMRCGDHWPRSSNKRAELGAEKSWAEWFLKNFEFCLLRLLPCDKRTGALLRTPSKTSSVVVLAFVPHWWGFFLLQYYWFGMVRQQVQFFCFSTIDLLHARGIQLPL